MGKADLFFLNAIVISKTFTDTSVGNEQPTMKSLFSFYQNILCRKDLE